MHRVSVPGDHIVVVGAGTSALVPQLAAEGTFRLTAVDISSAALAELERQLGPLASRVTYLAADVRTLTLPATADVWHDRATFHFLTTPEDQAAYVARVRANLRPGGHLVLAGFAPDGPAQCSGLDVVRHDVDSVRALFPGFALLDGVEEDHVTPWGSVQRFVHALFRFDS